MSVLDSFAVIVMGFLTTLFIVFGILAGILVWRRFRNRAEGA